LRRRDRHRHRAPARARPGRRRATHQLQVSRARLGADQTVTSSSRHPRARRRRAPGIPRHGQRPRLDSAPTCSGGCARTERLVLPPHGAGMRIGLFGGTFDPPHAAHLGASLLAMKRLKLDRVWWLVTPGNPLKDTRGLRPLAERMADARRLSRHPRVDVTGLEAVINTRYTYDTLQYLKRRCSGVRFVWVMGADNLRSFYRWQSWRRIANLMPMAVVDRMGSSFYATGGRAS